MAGNSQDTEKDQSSTAKDQNSPPSAAKTQETPAAKTTRRIAYILVFVYCSCLLIMLITAIGTYLQPGIGPDGKLLPHDNTWLLTFKDSFAFLAGLLATIIGYYFGNRNAGDAIEKAAQAREEVKVQETKATEAIEQAKVEQQSKASLITTIAELSKTNDQIKPEVSPTYDENAVGLITPPELTTKTGQ